MLIIPTDSSKQAGVTSAAQVKLAPSMHSSYTVLASARGQQGLAAPYRVGSQELNAVTQLARQRPCLPGSSPST